MNKGFTLVELLAILVVLGIITLVAVPGVITTNEKSRENDYNEFKKTVENAAEVYVETHIDDYKALKTTNGAQEIIDVDILKEVGLINSNLINPNTGEVVEGDIIIVSNDNGLLVYEFQEG